MRRHLLFIALMTIVVALIQPRPARAELILDVTLDTTALTVAPGESSGPFSLFFQLTDGSGTGNGNNTVVLSGFTFGGGAAFGPATLEGGAAGDVSTFVTLADTSFFNSFQQGFTAGSVLSFVLTMTTDVEPGGIPDAFAFGILDASGFPIASLDPALADMLLTFYVDSDEPAILTFATDLSRTNIAMSAASVSGSQAAPVPEPGSLSLLLLGSGVAGLAGCRARQTSRTRSDH